MNGSRLPWMILAVSALSVVFLGGKRRAFGIFVAQLHVEFNHTSLAELNWIGDSYAAVGYLTTGLSTSIILTSGSHFWASQLFGAIFILLACISSAYVPNPHWLFVTHTLLHGLGSSLILSTAGLVVNEHFDKNHRYHILATTLVSGGSVAAILFVELYAYLIESFGWRDAFTILGVIYFIVLIFGVVVFRRNPNKSDERNEKYALPGRHQLSCHKGILLFLWAIDRVVTSVVTYGMLLNLADYMYRSETSLRRSALLTTLFASGEACTYLVGVITTAVTRDLLKNRLRYVLIGTSFTMAVCLVVWELLSSHSGVSQFLSFACGFCLGPSITFLFPAGEELTMLPGHMAYPFSLGGMGLGMALSPLLSALVAQVFSYKWFFLVQGLLMFLKCGCLISSTILLASITGTDSTYIRRTSENCASHSDPDSCARDSSNCDVRTIRVAYFTRTQENDAEDEQRLLSDELQS